MGEAYDRTGAFLGSAEAQTKRDVFDKLMIAHPDAHEIRIRTIDNDGPKAEMPRYQCHKKVWALKIANVIDPTEGNNESDGSRILAIADPGYASIRVAADYVRKHNPTAGGYYVVYDDGYTSFSPAQAFEEGYTRL